MGRIIKQFQNGCSLEFSQGNFDNFCVYIVDENRNRTAPHDTEYFSDLKLLAETVGTDKVYEDFVKVYNMTGKTLEQSVLDEISLLSREYGTKSGMADVTFTILYATMIAEENKEYTKLGKRIKRLGVHMILKEQMSISEAANFTKGMRWRDIDRICNERNF